MKLDLLKGIIKSAHDANDAILIQGRHGIGKSNIVKQFAQENDYHIEELFLSHQEVGDLIGIPYTDIDGGRNITKWSVPIWLERLYKASAEGKQTVLFLDELNRAPQDVRQTALQLVLEKEIHEHKLPTTDGKQTMIVAAINPSDDYQVDELDPALKDRFLFLDIEVDARVWLKWASENEIHNTIIQFISKNPDKLHFTPQNGDNGSTPRSWAKLSAYLKNDIDDNSIAVIILGRLGTEVGSQFYNFYKDFSKYIGLEDVENAYKKLVKETPDIKPSKAGEKLKHGLLEGIEPIMIMNIADSFIKKYNKVKKSANLLPFMAFMYSTHLETRAAILKNIQGDDSGFYQKIVDCDKEYENKKMFVEIVANLDMEG